jgi:hypothetical protein
MITAADYACMSRYEKARIEPRRLDTLLWLESIDRLSDYGKAQLENFRHGNPTS